MIQERIKELGSAILNIKNQEIHLTGFMSEERLFDYLVKNKDCRFSEGLYKKKDFDISYIRDNALFIILEDDIEICRYRFDVLKIDTVKYKGEDNKPKSKVFTIRHCKFSNKYNYKDIDKSLLFNSKTDLLFYFFDTYGKSLDL